MKLLESIRNGWNILLNGKEKISFIPQIGHMPKEENTNGSTFVPADRTTGGNFSQKADSPMQPSNREAHQPMPENVVPFNEAAAKITSSQAPAAPADPVHCEYLTMLRSRDETLKIVELIKNNTSVFLDMEYITTPAERQSCIDVLSGAAYALGCRMNRISTQGIYLISPPTVNIMCDESMKNIFAQAESQMQPKKRQSYEMMPNAPYTSPAFTQGMQASPDMAQSAAHYRGTPTERFASPIYQNTGNTFIRRQSVYNGTDGINRGDGQ